MNEDPIVAALDELDRLLVLVGYKNLHEALDALYEAQSLLSNLDYATYGYWDPELIAGEIDAIHTWATREADRRAAARHDSLQHSQPTTPTTNRQEV